MKKIEAIIRPSRLEEVQKALAAIDLSGMTITEVKGLGRQKGHTELYRGAEYSVDFLPKLKLELIVSEEKLKEALDVISQAASTENVGDGKLFVTQVNKVIRIRTGDEDATAL